MRLCGQRGWRTSGLGSGCSSSRNTRAGWGSGMRSAAAVTACAVASLGCTSTVAAPPGFPAFHVDEEASEVSVRAASGQKIPEETAAGARAQAKEILEDMIAERSDLAGAKPARFKAQITSDTEVWPMFACVIFLTIVGCPAVIVEDKVRLTFEVDGQRFQGSGTGRGVASIYYNITRYQSRKEAIQNAIQDAYAKGPQPR